MLEQLNPQNMLDIGFVLLVSIACIRSLWGSSASAEHNRRQLRAELESLEETLRTLISEAGSASSRLDRSLLQRKQELEKLLIKLDNKEKSLSVNGEQPRRYASAAASSFRGETEDELPNESWNESPIQRSGIKGSPSRESSPRSPERFILGTENKPAATKAAATNGKLLQRAKVAGQTAPNRAAALEKQLAVMAEATDDSISLSSRAAANLSLPATAPKQPKTLQEEIELIRSDPLEGKAFIHTSIVDPTTYRIARRLLLEGKEIHVVARKLDLPVSEIRELDRLLREQLPAAAPKQTAAAQLPNRRASAGQSLPEASSFQESPQEIEIQREVALL